MRLHVILEPDSPARFRELGLLAESLGFEAVWAPNILSARDPFLAFSQLAPASRALRMGPIAISPFELHPVKIANSLLALNELAHGRAAIVIGGGGGALIGMGLKPDRQANFPRMVRGVRECVAFLRAVSPAKPLDFAGELFRVEGYHPDWATAPAPLVYVAANGPQMLKLAATVGDGVMLSDISRPHLGATLTTIRTALGTRTPAAGPFRIHNLLAWHVKADRAAAYAEARRKLWVRGIWERSRLEPFIAAADCDLVAKNLPGLAAAYQRGEDPASVVPARILDALADGLTLTGTPGGLDRLVEELLAFRAAGVTELGLRLYGAPADSLRLLAARVGPALR